MKMQIERSSDVKRSARVMQLEGLFDVPLAKKSALSWKVDLPIEERPWNIGLIVGPSGCGKSTIARELFGKDVVAGFAWAKDKSLLDSFPAAMGIKDITELLSSVGFSSPPSWVRPFEVLSNGEQFRTLIARALCERTDLCVIDEFTSVVDRTVAKIGSAAIAKTVRRRKSKFIAVTCHYDVEDWLDPDWTYDPSIGKFRWRALRGKPKIELTIYRVGPADWPRFAPHHYLTTSLATAAVNFCAFYEGQPVAWHSFMHFVGLLKDGKPAMRVHRSVCLPDFQGVGIGNAVSVHLASMYAALGSRIFLSTGHPAVIAGALRSPAWRLTRSPSRTTPDRRDNSVGYGGKSRASKRLTASFEYCGAVMDLRQARRQFTQVMPASADSAPADASAPPAKLKRARSRADESARAAEQAHRSPSP